MRHIILIISIILITSPLASNATSLSVPTQYPTIQAGIYAATVGDTVLLDLGIYNGEGNRDIDFMGKEITVRSLDGNPATCTIVCQGSELHHHRGFIFQSGEGPQALLEGITVTGGYVPYEYEEGNGGGILCINGSSPTIRNCRLSHCASGYRGGGIAIINASPTIIDCQIDNNFSSFGGGIAVVDDCSFTMTGSLIMDNWGDYGGGIYLDSHTSFLSHCVIANNSSTGIEADKRFTLTYCTIIGNFLGMNASDNATIENTLIASNHYSISDISTRIDLSCCNIFGHYGENWDENIVDQLGANGNISADPLLCDPDNWDYHIASDSPCLNDTCGQIGAFGAGDCGDPATPAGNTISTHFGLRGNYPNPFNPSTTISYTLALEGPVTLKVFDVTGKLVRTLVNQSNQVAGPHNAIWNGKDNYGNSVAGASSFTN